MGTDGDDAGVSWWVSTQQGERSQFYARLAVESTRIQLLRDAAHATAIDMARPRKTRKQKRREAEEDV